MRRKPLSRYWLFQILGWSVFALINIFFAIIFDQLTANMMYRLVFFVEIGLLFSHLMREAIHRMDILLKSLQQQVINFIMLTIVFAMLVAMIRTPFELICGLHSLSTSDEDAFQRLFFINFGPTSSLLFVWNSIYFMYHYVMKSRKQQMDTLQLEALVKALELKTIKAHINPHFIFNALNSIRALIDENPQRARAAITELSNILRSSLSADKSETVSFKEELKIVKDYLALENMRFEDRLQVEYDVAEESLNQQVPPMMLQTLVENAIKHGISKQVKGGIVKITSGLNGNLHQLSVQNTGHLNGAASQNGFGLSSTQDRLSLLYGDKAKFEIRQLNPTVVEARVTIPVQ
ncbi:MAG TPA: histidine kinase [Chitinophagaceae bacterium]|nr:histidine kinase [Chitinophagaceae bacterium]